MKPQMRRTPDAAATSGEIRGLARDIRESQQGATESRERAARDAAVTGIHAERLTREVNEHERRMNERCPRK